MLTALLRTAPVVNVPSSPPAAVPATSSISGRPSSTRPESTRNMPRRIADPGRQVAVVRRVSQIAGAIDLRERRDDVPACPCRIRMRDREVAVGRGLGCPREQPFGLRQPGRRHRVLEHRGVLTLQGERGQRGSRVVAACEERLVRGLADRDGPVRGADPERRLREALEVLRFQRTFGGHGREQLVRTPPSPFGDGCPGLVEGRRRRLGLAHAVDGATDARPGGRRPAATEHGPQIPCSY